MPLDGTVDDRIVGPQELLGDRDAMSQSQDSNILELQSENRAKSGIFEDR